MRSWAFSAPSSCSALYFLFLLRGVRLIGYAKDSFGALIITGVVSMIFGHILINVGMTLGVMPVTGLPLPFASVGGTSLVSNLLGVAMILNVHMRRQRSSSERSGHIRRPWPPIYLVREERGARLGSRPVSGKTSSLPWCSWLIVAAINEADLPGDAAARGVHRLCADDRA